MRVLITGVAGFIGSNLALRLMNEGHEVIGIDNFITGKRNNVTDLLSFKRFRFIEHDVIYPLNITESLDWIMHFASPASPQKYMIYPFETLRVNSEGTYHLLELSYKRNAKFLLASTSEVYGDPVINPQMEDYWGNVNPCGVRSVYDEAKRYAEAITLAAHRSKNLSVRIIRIFNTYGPRMDINDGRVITNFINQIFHNCPVSIYGDGTQTRSFQYIDDLIEGIMRLINIEYHSPVNFGNTKEITILDLVKIFEEIIGHTLEVEFLPKLTDDPRQRKPDISLAKKLLNWESKVNLQFGLKKTMDYFSLNLASTSNFNLYSASK